MDPNPIFYSSKIDPLIYGLGISEWPDEEISGLFAAILDQRMAPGKTSKKAAQTLLQLLIDYPVDPENPPKIP